MNTPTSEVENLLTNCEAIKGKAFAEDLRLILACGMFARGTLDERARYFALGIASNLAARYRTADGERVDEEFGRMVDTGASIVGLPPLELHKMPGLA